MTLSKIKVLIVLPSAGGYGGMEASSLGLAKAIRGDADFAARICFWRGPAFQLQPSAKMMFENEELIYADGIFDRDLADAIRWADVVHAQAVIPAVALLARLRGKRLVINVFNSKRGSLLERLAIGLAHERGKRSTPPLHEGWTLPNERRGFVFAGRWVATKGLDTLIDAYAQAKLDREQWPLVLMGDGPLRSLIEYAIHKRGITGVKVLGFVDEATKVETIKNARWMIIPSPATAIEAAHLGVPCLFHEGDFSTLAEALTRASAISEAEYAGHAERAREDVKTELVPPGIYPRRYRQLLRGQKDS